MQTLTVFTCSGTGGVTTGGLLGIGAAGVPTCNPSSAGQWKTIQVLEPSDIPDIQAGVSAGGDSFWSTQIDGGQFAALLSAVILLWVAAYSVRVIRNLLR